MQLVNSTHLTDIQGPSHQATPDPASAQRYMCSEEAQLGLELGMT